MNIDDFIKKILSFLWSHLGLASNKYDEGIVIFVKNIIENWGDMPQQGTLSYVTLVFVITTAVVSYIASTVPAETITNIPIETATELPNILNTPITTAPAKLPLAFANYSEWLKCLFNPFYIDTLSIESFYNCSSYIRSVASNAIRNLIVYSNPVNYINGSGAGSSSNISGSSTNTVSNLNGVMPNGITNIPASTTATIFSEMTMAGPATERVDHFIRFVQDRTDNALAVITPANMNRFPLVDRITNELLTLGRGEAIIMFQGSIYGYENAGLLERLLNINAPTLNLRFINTEFFRVNGTVSLFSFNDIPIGEVAERLTAIESDIIDEANLRDVALEELRRDIDNRVARQRNLGELERANDFRYTVTEVLREIIRIFNNRN